MNNGGVVGLGVVLTVIGIIVALIVLAITGMLVGSTMVDTYETIEDDVTGSVTNESITGLDEAGDALAYSSYRDATCSVSAVVNATGGNTVDSTNYTVSNCGITSTGTAPWNGTNIRVTYTYSYERSYGYDISSNMSGGFLSFFNQIPTVFTILVVVIIIAIISLMIYVITRFGNPEGIM